MQLPVTKPHSSVNQCLKQTLYMLYGSVRLLLGTDSVPSLLEVTAELAALLDP